MKLIRMDPLDRLQYLADSAESADRRLALSTVDELRMLTRQVIAEVRSLRAENDTLRAQLHRHTRTGTIGGEVGSHWPQCWRTHIDCAELEIERLRALLLASEERGARWMEKATGAALAQAQEQGKGGE